MQLWYAPTSPFARKVRVAVEELGLAAALELVEVNPWTDDRLRALNPLSKVPTLVRDNGSILYESSVICDYLDSLAPPRRLFPPDGPARWQALLLQGLADGAATSAGRLFADERRPADQRSDAMMQRFRIAIDTTLAELDKADLSSSFTIGELTVAVLLGYLDFRWPDSDWRPAHPHLAAWFAETDRRPSMQATRHRPL